MRGNINCLSHGMHIIKGKQLANILYVDIETAPSLAYVWRMWKENIGVKQLKEHNRVLSFSAIWNDDDDSKVMYFENRSHNDKKLIKTYLTLADRADVIIGHNVQNFDCATMNGRAMILGLKPPSPYKVVDTYQAAKKEFKLEANSLEYLSAVLGVKNKKLSHKKFPGFELWSECLAQNEEAWDEMKEYNIVDTLAVREVYKIMRPWIRNHANLAVFEESAESVCPKCGSHHLQRRGYAYTNVGKYQRFVCTDCDGWSRTRFTEYPKDRAKNLLVNVQ